MWYDWLEGGGMNTELEQCKNSIRAWFTRKTSTWNNDIVMTIVRCKPSCASSKWIRRVVFLNTVKAVEWGAKGSTKVPFVGCRSDTTNLMTTGSDERGPRWNLVVSFRYDVHSDSDAQSCWCWKRKRIDASAEPVHSTYPGLPQINSRVCHLKAERWLINFIFFWEKTFSAEKK